MPPPETVTAAYGVDELRFGPDYLIPKPFDTRLIVELPPAVAKAAMDSGVATRPLADLHLYRQRLSQRVIRSGLMMKPIFEAAAANPQRLVYTDGEEERVLRAVQVVVEERLAKPILIGRPRSSTHGSRSSGSAFARVRTTSWSIRPVTRATTTMSPAISSAPAAMA